jgi:DNA-binding transcriptional LysR family regulator
MPSIRTLRTFITVTRLGSFAAAGQAVGLTAAAVGQQMRALEEELRRPLFDRSGRAVVLNTAGRELCGPVEDLLARYEALTQDAEGQPLGGRVVMGALVSALMGAFADALWALKRENPGLEVTLFAGQSRDFADRVSRGELDAAVVTQAPGTLAANLMWTPLYHEPMVLIVPRKPAFKLPREPLDVLAAAPFLRFDRLTWTGKLVDEALARCGAAPVRDEMELNSVEAIIALVRQGLGVSIVPKLANLVWSRDRTLAVLPLPGAAVQRHVGLLERRQHSRERFTHEIKRYFVQQHQPGL